MPRRITPRIVGIVALVAGALPAAAGATTNVSYHPSGQTPPARTGVNDLFIEGDGAGDKISVQWRTDVQPFRVQVNQLEVVSPVTLVAGQNCTNPSPNAVHCNAAATLRVDAFLEGGDDTLEEHSLADSSFFSSPLFVNAGSGNDRVVGGRGNDILQGSSGDDRLEGGPGNDFLGGSDVGHDGFSGGAGRDTLDARDNSADAFVSCGSQPLGESDRATVDLVDPKVGGCEIVERFASDDGPPGMALTKRLRIARSGRAGVRIACPRDARVRCRGRARLRDPRRRSRVLASATYNAPLRARRSVVFQLTAAERALLLRRRKALFTTTEKGVSRKGPRSVERILRVTR